MISDFGNDLTQEIPYWIKFKMIKKLNEISKVKLAPQWNI